MLKTLIAFVRSGFKMDAIDENSIDSFRINKFKQVILVTCVCLIIITSHFIYLEKYETVVVLGLMFIVTAVCLFWAMYSSVKVASSFFLTLLTSACCYFMWRFDGLSDEALIAFPGLLIFAAVITNFRFAVFLLLIMIANVFAIGYVNQYGIYTNIPLASSVNNAFVISAILVLITFTVSFLASELQQLLIKLNKENLRVKKSQKEIERLLNHDVLTGLPNRVLAEEFFGQHVKHNSQTKRKTALVFIDVDDFKSVNDTLGHSMGDQYLKALSSKLRLELRGADSLCRVAGDEFVIIAEHSEHGFQESTLALRILDSLKQPICLSGVPQDTPRSLASPNPSVVSDHQIVLSASIGIAIYPDDGEDFETLCNNADLAMYKAKNAGRNNYSYFNADMSKDNSRQLAIAQALRVAIENNELTVHYQGKHSLSTTAVVGAEALLRWNSEKLGKVSPVDFIPVAERSGSIIEIGEWVLNEAVKTCKEWHLLGHTNMSISVNVSSIQLKRGNFENIVLSALEKYDLAGKFLVLELTESILVDMHEALSTTIRSIKNAGVRLAIDDFGTGYSNLGYLKKLDINMLKIDRSFISKISTSEHDLAIVTAIIEISNSLGIECVAEGIESADIAVKLQALKCDLGQGYFWNRPMDADNFKVFLKRD